MNRHRRAAGFKPLGCLHPREIDLPARKALDLCLAHAWRLVAGEALASRAPAGRVSRGVLHIHVDDPRWAPVVRRVLPRLAGRLAGRFPELGVKKLRLRIGGADETSRAQTVVPDPPGPSPAAPAPRSTKLHHRTQESSPPLGAGVGIEDLADRYMERTRKGPR